MLSAITGAFGGLKEATALLKTFNQLKTDAQIAEKNIALNQLIAQIQQDLFAAQTAYSAVCAEKDQLEKQLMQMENWAREQQRYQLHQMTAGGLTFRIKESVRGSEPVHDLCAHCYQNGIKSILQISGIEKGIHWYVCSCCGEKVASHRASSQVHVIDIDAMIAPPY